MDLADIGLEEIFRKHNWKVLSDELSKEINELPEVKLLLRNTKFKRSQEALFDLIIGNFENRQSV